MPVEKTIAGASLAEVLDRVLDKGLVIDAWVRASLVGIEFLGIEARVVVASVETYRSTPRPLDSPQAPPRKWMSLFQRRLWLRVP